MFCSEDSSMWCRVLFSVRLKLCFSGLVMMVVMCEEFVSGLILSCVGLISLV